MPDPSPALRRALPPASRRLPGTGSPRAPAARARAALLRPLAALLLALPLAAAAEEAKPAAPAAPPNMESYQLVLLWRGPRWSPEVTPETRRIQEEHIGHLKAMGATGKLVIAGPVSDAPDPALRGLCLYRAGSLAEARALAEKDPAVQAGRLRVEVLTWWVEKGYMTFPKAPAPAP